jgi:hypothetical protein
LRLSNLKLQDSSLQFIIFCLILTTAKAIWLFFNGIPLYADEAQYWLWSKSLDFGYYSKPPVIAFLIKTSTSIFGDTEAGARFLSPIFHCATAFSIFSLAKNLYSAQTARIAALTYVTLPAIFFSSMLISTDVPLMLIWTLALDQFYKALQHNHIKNWLMLGLLFGLGMLTKYHFAIFGIAGLIFIYQTKKTSDVLSSYKPYIAGLIALSVFSPNILWNINNHFASFSHTADLASSGDSIINIKSCLQFLGAQLLILGPFLCVALISILRNHSKLSQQDLFLIIFSITFFIFITLISLASKAYANWAAPAYVPLIIFICAQSAVLGMKKILSYNFVFQIILGAIFLLYPLFMNTLGLPDPYNRMRGMDEVANIVSNLHTDLGDVTVIADDRKIYASIVFYTNPHIYDLKKWNPTHRLKDHFDLTASTDVVQPTSIFISAYATEEYLREFTDQKVELRFESKDRTKIFVISNKE